MQIIETNFKWNNTLQKRSSTKYIVLHHRAGNGDAKSIHEGHLNQGWSGIGYHFYIRKDGSIYRGRPINTVGAHTQGYNSVSVGVCFEGNYENEKSMSPLQLKAGQDLVSYLKELYPSAEVLGHRDLQASACPGKYFPLDEIKNPPTVKLENANDITWELNHKHFPIDDIGGFVKALHKAKEDNSPLYWGYYKLVNGGEGMII